MRDSLILMPMLDPTKGAAFGTRNIGVFEDTALHGR